jgi:hypothetical protein
MPPPLDTADDGRMGFNPKRAFNIEVIGIATVVLSMAALVVLFFAL